MASQRLALGLLVALSPVAAEALAQPTPGAAALAEAERRLVRARGELEEIVGSELLDAPPPRLPDVPGIELAPEDGELVARLQAAGLDQWSPVDAQRLESALARHATALADLTSTEEKNPYTQGVVPSVLQGCRLRSLQDRWSLARGDEAAFLEGLEARSRWAERLRLQPEILAGIVATALQTTLLADIQLAAEAEATSDVLLSALDWLLAGWERLPDAATALAREALSNLEQAEELSRSHPHDLGSGDPGVYSAVWLEPSASDFAYLARRCREAGCKRAITELRERAQGDDDPYRALAEIVLPNLFDALLKIEGVDRLRELARAAIALRQRAVESGAYPIDLEELPATIAAGRGELPGLIYHLEGGIARLELDAPHDPAPPASGTLGDLRESLRVWKLPSVEARSEP